MRPGKSKKEKPKSAYRIPTRNRQTTQRHTSLLSLSISLSYTHTTNFNFSCTLTHNLFSLSPSSSVLTLQLQQRQFQCLNPRGDWLNCSTLASSLFHVSSLYFALFQFQLLSQLAAETKNQIRQNSVRKRKKKNNKKKQQSLTSSSDTLSICDTHTLLFLSLPLFSLFPSLSH